MKPIFGQADLLKYLKDHVQHRIKEEWFLVILANPNSSSEALDEIYKNYVYLDSRTENVVYFMPGYANTFDGIQRGNHSSSPNTFVIVGEKGKFTFNPIAFFDTIEWLESYGYEYSESAELLFIKHNMVPDYCIKKAIEIHDRFEEWKQKCPPYIDYHDEWKRITRSTPTDFICAGFDLEHIISFNLDNMVQRHVNLTSFFRRCNVVVKGDITINELKEQYYCETAENSLFLETPFFQREIKVFIAGSKELTMMRDIVRSSLMGIVNKSRKGYYIRAYSFEDFATTMTPDGQQEAYMRFIRNEADYAIFILDSRIGGITHKEFIEALNSYKQDHRPKILVYNRKTVETEQKDEEINKIIAEINNYSQYYTEFSTDKELSYLIQIAFMSYV